MQRYWLRSNLGCGFDSHLYASNFSTQECKTNQLAKPVYLYVVKGLQSPYFRRPQLYYVEMGPDPTRAYFWPVVNKRPTCLWPRYFPTRPKAIFFYPKGKKLKNLTFLGEIFQILTQTINGWSDPTRPEPQKIDPTQPGSKFFDPDPSLVECLSPKTARVKMFCPHI